MTESSGGEAGRAGKGKGGKHPQKEKFDGGDRPITCDTKCSPEQRKPGVPLEKKVWIVFEQEMNPTSRDRSGKASSLKKITELRLKGRLDDRKKKKEGQGRPAVRQTRRHRRVFFSRTKGGQAPRPSNGMKERSARTSLPARKRGQRQPGGGETVTCLLKNANIFREEQQPHIS